MSRGLDFCIPPWNVIKEQVFAEFEIIYSQLLHHKPSSLDKLTFCMSKISDLACEFAFLSVERNYFAWRWAYFRTIRSLKSRNDIYIRKPDKGAGVVFLNKQGCKMNVRLGDDSKF